MKHQVTITLTRERHEWLTLMAFEAGQTIEAVAAAAVHNATLDYQQDHYPDSDASAGIAQLVPEG